MARTLWSTAGFTNKLCVLLAGPGWSPGKPRLGLTDDLPDVLMRTPSVLCCASNNTSSTNSTLYCSALVLDLYCTLTYCKCGSEYFWHSRLAARLVQVRGERRVSFDPKVAPLITGYCVLHFAGALGATLAIADNLHAWSAPLHAVATAHILLTLTTVAWLLERRCVPPSRPLRDWSRPGPARSDSPRRDAEHSECSREHTSG